MTATVTARSFTCHGNGKGVAFSLGRRSHKTTIWRFRPFFLHRCRALRCPQPFLRFANQLAHSAVRRFSPHPYEFFQSDERGLSPRIAILLHGWNSCTPFDTAESHAEADATDIRSLQCTARRLPVCACPTSDSAFPNIVVQFRSNGCLSSTSVTACALLLLLSCCYYTTFALWREVLIVLPIILCKVSNWKFLFSKCIFPR